MRTAQITYLVLMTLPRNCRYLSQPAGKFCLMEEVVGPPLGISHSEWLIPAGWCRLFSLIWSLQCWFIARADCREAAEARLSLSCALLSKREALSSRSEEVLAGPGMCNIPGTTKHGVLQEWCVPCISDVRWQAYRTVLNLYFGTAQARSSSRYCQKLPYMSCFCKVLKMP